MSGKQVRQVRQITQINLERYKKIYKTIESPDGSKIYTDFYPFYPKQEECSSLYVKYRLYGWARGWGKSHWLRGEAVRQCLSAPGIRGLILRKTFPEVYQNTILPLLNELPQDLYKHNDSKWILTFYNGSSIKFSYCRNIKDVLQYQWVEFDFIAIEELTHWTEPMWKTLMWSLRTTKEWVAANFFWTTNPGGIWHEWVRRLWIDRSFAENEDKSEYGFVQSFIYDNPVLQAIDPGYVKSLEALPDTQRRALLEWDWDAFEGQYFKEFSRPLHVIDPYIPIDLEIKKRIIAFDYWYAAPSAVYWLAQLTNGRIVCYREIYETQLTYKRLALRIKELTTPIEWNPYIVWDPAVVNKKNEITESTLQEEFNTVWLAVSPANNNRLSWWLHMRQALQWFQDPNTKLVDSVLKITTNCANLIRTISLQLHDERNVEDLDTSLEDHAVDALRYGLMEFRVVQNSFSSIKKANKGLSRKTQPTATWRKAVEFWKKRRPSQKNILTTNF